MADDLQEHATQEPEPLASSQSFRVSSAKFHNAKSLRVISGNIRSTHSLRVISGKLHSEVTWVGKVWNRLQVELHGRFSTQRINAMSDYHSRTSWWRAVLVCIVTPLPALFTITALDIAPVKPPTDGSNANYVYWIRTYIAVVLMIGSMIQHFVHVFLVCPCVIRITANWRSEVPLWYWLHLRTLALAGLSGSVQSHCAIVSSHSSPSRLYASHLDPSLEGKPSTAQGFAQSTVCVCGSMCHDIFTCTVLLRLHINDSISAIHLHLWTPCAQDLLEELHQSDVTSFGGRQASLHPVQHRRFQCIIRGQLSAVVPVVDQYDADHVGGYCANRRINHGHPRHQS